MFSNTENTNRINNMKGIIPESLTEEENKTLERYAELVTRRSVVTSNIRELDELMDDDVGLFDRDGFKGYAVTYQVLKNWEKEINDEMNSLNETITRIVYKDTVNTWVNAIREAFTNHGMSNKGWPKGFAKLFLDEKFGEGDSPSKDAIKDICVECMTFFVNMMMSADIEQVVMDM